MKPNILVNPKSCVNNHKFAFTLAEVLITLGIIGVVAAITIPTLVQNYRRHVVANKLKTDISILQQALLRSISDNGTPDTWEIGDGDGDTFDIYFKPYIKVLKEGTMGFYVKDTYNQENAGLAWRKTYKLSNGTIVTFRAGAVSAVGFNRRGRFEILISEKKNTFYIGKDKLPYSQYIYGKDIFAFNFIINEDDRKFYITSISDYPKDYLLLCKKPPEYLKEICLNGSGGRGYTSGIGCSALLECNGWEFPKDYPIKF